MRRVILGVLFGGMLGIGCAHGLGDDPLPARAKADVRPDVVKDHPGFVGTHPSVLADPPNRSSKPRDPSCVLHCAEGQHCEIVQGVDRCIPNDQP